MAFLRNKANKSLFRSRVVRTFSGEGSRSLRPKAPLRRGGSFFLFRRVPVRRASLRNAVPSIALDAKLAKGPLPQLTVLESGVQPAKGLAVAHREAIIHRDLKPETRDMLAGTLPYMAPFSHPPVNVVEADETCDIAPWRCYNRCVGVIYERGRDYAKGSWAV